MSENRPSPLAAAESLRHLATLHHQLDQHITHRPATNQAERVTDSEGTEHPAPGHWLAVAIRADIHHAAVRWAAMLIDHRGLKAPTPTTTEALLEFAATYPGYFTENDDPGVAHELVDTCDTLIHRASSTLDPDTETRRTPIGPCMVDDCAGTLIIKWTTFEGDDEDRAWRMGNSRPVAKCNKDGAHKIDAMLYAAGRRA